MKIMIFGYPGSGKSTAAKIIGEKLNYPILNTDKILFNKNWIKKDIKNPERRKAPIWIKKRYHFLGVRVAILKLQIRHL